MPVIPVQATKGTGLTDLKSAIREAKAFAIPIRFSEPVEEAIEALATEVGTSIAGKVQYPHPVRTLAIHLLEHNSLDEYLLTVYPDLEGIIERLQSKIGEKCPVCGGCFRGCIQCPASEEHPVLPTCIERTNKARHLAREVVHTEQHPEGTLTERIERVIDRPVTGVPILAFLLFLTYKAVVLSVSLTEQGISYLVTFISQLQLVDIPMGPVTALLAKSVNEGVVAPFGVVMPAMVCVYTIIALMEDTGLMARMAVMLDRLTRLINLPGQSIIPLLLGFGCRAPAVGH